MIIRLGETMLSAPELKHGQIISLFAHLACEQPFLGLLGLSGWGGRNGKGYNFM